MTERADFAARLAASGVPDYMQPGVERYVLKGILPGHFLTALLSNDLRGTFERADDTNQRAVLDYIRLLYNHAPSQCWGSRDRVKDWVELGGWEGLDAQYAAAVPEDEMAAEARAMGITARD